jgi:hypothetical protein
MVKHARSFTKRMAWVRRWRLWRDQYGVGGALRRGFHQDPVSFVPEQGRVVGRYNVGSPRPLALRGRAASHGSPRSRGGTVYDADNLRALALNEEVAALQRMGAAGGRQALRCRRDVLCGRCSAQRHGAGGLLRVQQMRGSIALDDVDEAAGMVASVAY